MSSWTHQAVSVLVLACVGVAKVDPQVSDPVWVAQCDGVFSVQLCILLALTDRASLTALG